VVGKALHGSVLSNFAHGMQFLNRWIELLYLIFSNSSTGPINPTKTNAVIVRIIT